MGETYELVREIKVGKDVQVMKLQKKNTKPLERRMQQNKFYNKYHCIKRASNSRISHSGFYEKTYIYFGR